MHVRWLLVSLLMLPVFAGAASMDLLKDAQGALSGSLSGLLQSQFDVDQKQAEGGIGSILTLAQEHLTAGDFDRVAGLVPGASDYLETAKRLGAVGGPIGNVTGLNDALGRLGISPETAAKFVPYVSDFLGKAGGEDVKALLDTLFAG